MSDYYKHRRAAKSVRVVIKCPNCGCSCNAVEEIYPGDSFWTFVHQCQRCQYTITESEWNVIKPNLGEGSVIECTTCKGQFENVDGYLKHRGVECNSQGLIVTRKK